MQSVAKITRKVYSPDDFCHTLQQAMCYEHNDESILKNLICVIRVIRVRKKVFSVFQRSWVFKVFVNLSSRLALPLTFVEPDCARQCSKTILTLLSLNVSLLHSDLRRGCRLRHLCWSRKSRSCRHRALVWRRLRRVRGGCLSCRSSASGRCARTRG